MATAPPRKKQRTSLVSEEVDAPAVSEAQIAEFFKNAETAKPKTETAADSDQKTQLRQLFVRALPASTTSESLTELFSQNYPIKHATAVLDKETKQCKGYGFVTFADADDAARAKDDFNGHVIDGKKLRIEIAEHRQRDEHGVTQKPEKVKPEEKKDEGHLEKGTRLIVRNLPWSIKGERQLEKIFLSYGKIKSSQVVKKKGGLLAGFAFVTMRGRKNAEKAIEGVNGKEIDGRTVAVDWAVEKEVYLGLQDAAEEQPSKAKKEKDDFVKLDGTEETDEMDDMVRDEDDEELDDEDEDDGDFMKDEEALKALEVGGEEEDPDVAEKNMKEDKSATIFIRNLPFTCTDEDLEDHFTQFGTTRYARIVVDPTTDRPRGTGFVAFYDPEAAEECLRHAPRPQMPHPKDARHKGNQQQQSHSVLQDETLDPTGKYTLEGRVLQVTRAVDKREANRLRDEGVAHRYKRDNDKRRLYLLSEGTIPSNSPAYEKLPPSERTMREASAKQRKQLIESNPSLHLSLTRLAVRNIPRSVTSKDLKQLAREAIVGFAIDAKEGRRERLSKEELSRGGEDMIKAEEARREAGKGVVKQATIVFEGREGSKVSEKTGGGRSRGYGFIEYHTHRSALMGLRWLNGHQVDYTTLEMEKNKNEKGKNITTEALQEKKKRLIVEFAIENVNVVKRRAEREAQAKEYAKNPKPKEEPRERVIRGRDGKVVHHTKRKRDPSTLKPAEEEPKQDLPEDEKLAKRQRIIQKKRMQRRAKKTGKPFRA